VVCDRFTPQRNVKKIVTIVTFLMKALYRKGLTGDDLP
jgi:hypothetical protein